MTKFLQHHYFSQYRSNQKCKLNIFNCFTRKKIYTEMLCKLKRELSNVTTTNFNAPNFTKNKHPNATPLMRRLDQFLYVYLTNIYVSTWVQILGSYLDDLDKFSTTKNPFATCFKI